MSGILRSIRVGAKAVGIRITKPAPTQRVRDGRGLWMAGGVVGLESSLAQQVCQLPGPNRDRVPFSPTGYLHLDRGSGLLRRFPAWCHPTSEIVAADVEVILRAARDA